jgi:hypothetical protein
MVKIVWPVVEDMIQSAIDESNEELSVHHIKKRLIEQDMILLTVAVNGEFVAACTLEIRHFDTGKKVMHVCTLGGAGFEEWWEEMGKAFDELAIDHDCSEVYIIGRPGWKRLLKDKGYDLVHTVLRKKVGEN